jgi:hypothetical protein
MFDILIFLVPVSYRRANFLFVYIAHLLRFILIVLDSLVSKSGVLQKETESQRGVYSLLLAS